jgi:3-oxoacyl-[acyl-carrier-protein] synthase III
MANKTMADVDVFVPHQANLRINEFVARKLDIPMEKVVEVMAKQRPCVMTNPSFVEQLEEFGSRGKNK